MDLDIVVPIVGGLLAVGVVWIIVIRHRIGVLNAASRLVIFGAVVLAFEHPFFAMTLSARVIYPEAHSITTLVSTSSWLASTRSSVLL